MRQDAGGFRCPVWVDIGVPAAQMDNKTDDLVLANGVPKMKEFRQDLAKTGIPFLDGRGRRMDYHACVRRSTHGFQR